MRTKTIGRWRRAALSGLVSATLGAPMAHAQQTPAAPADEQPRAGEAAPAGENAARPAAPEATGPVAVPGSPEVYTIQKGDTLWDLSQKFLSNPWYWPKIWSLNPGIENPHWIYPGNRLKIVPGEGGAQAPAQVQGEAGAGAGEGEKTPAEQAADTGDLPRTPAGSGADIEVVNRNGRLSAAAGNSVSVSGKLTFTPPPNITVRTSGLVSPDELREAGTLDASFEEKELLANFDTAYIRFKGESAPVKAGDKMILFRPDGAVVHPLTKKKLADKTKTVGVVKVLTVNGNLATVQIESTYEEVSRGDLARPWVAQEKRVAPRPNLKDVSAVIVSALNPGLTTFGEANEVFLDKGTADGVQEGNTFAVVRKGDGLSNAMVTRSYTAGDQGDVSAKTRVPDENVGLLLVVDSKEHLSTAIVVKSIRELQAGDDVEMRTSGAGGP